MQEGVKDREAEDEMSKNIRKAPPTKFPPIMFMRVDARESATSEKSAAQRPLPVKHAPGTWQASFSGSDPWKEAPPNSMLIQEEDAASWTRLRTPQSVPANAKEMRIVRLVSRAPPAQPEDVELTKMRKVIAWIMCFCWRSVEVTQMSQELQERCIQVDKVQLFWIVQELYSTCVPVGSKIVLVPQFPVENWCRRWQ